MRCLALVSGPVYKQVDPHSMIGFRSLGDCNDDTDETPPPDDDNKITESFSFSCKTGTHTKKSNSTHFAVVP